MTASVEAADGDDDGSIVACTAACPSTSVMPQDPAKLAFVSTP
jgi:hypothetical protein